MMDHAKDGLVIQECDKNKQIQTVLNAITIRDVMDSIPRNRQAVQVVEIVLPFQEM